METTCKKCNKEIKEGTLTMSCMCGENRHAECVESSLPEQIMKEVFEPWMLNREITMPRQDWDIMIKKIEEILK